MLLNSTAQYLDRNAVDLRPVVNIGNLPVYRLVAVSHGAWAQLSVLIFRNHHLRHHQSYLFMNV